ncbi:hypothetical protein SAMN05421780_108178 [Flexibacter flexilis DSM 6793]|uniref:Uncharacterized protein n=1 Tax=Flexibacter flexilis DSM 6793 TaxID=927664 RepID=A0A1I1LDB7_9BACT|nr:hypothetical protein [Flexibacter flexilis]SFC70975.1 hypothetical protein SAMN05421780_108178 [Flexibacter flexilis DSM 6793]
MTTPNVLSTQESNRLLDLEAVIEKNKQAFLEVGAALLEIQEKRLYREGYNTFEEYISEKHGIGRSTAYQYIKAAGVRQELAQNGVTELPQNEAQYRELANVSPVHRSEVWQEATEIAQATGQKVTAKSVSAIADKRKPKVEVQDVTAEEVPQQITFYIDVPMQVAPAPPEVREAGFGLGGLHKKSAIPTPQAEPEPSALEEEIAELKQRPTQLEYQIALGKIEELEKQAQAALDEVEQQLRNLSKYSCKEITLLSLSEIMEEVYQPGQTFVSGSALAIDLLAHCRSRKMNMISIRTMIKIANNIAEMYCTKTDNGLIYEPTKKPAQSSIYPEKMYLIEYSLLSSKNKLEEEIADFLRALDGDIVHDIERFFEYMNDKIQATNTRHKRCKPLKKMDISSFYNHLKEVRTYTFLSSQLYLCLCDSIAVKITPVSPLNF